MLSAIGLFSVSGRRRVRNPADSPLIPNTTNGTEGLRDFIDGTNGAKMPPNLQDMEHTPKPAFLSSVGYSSDV